MREFIRGRATSFDVDGSPGMGQILSHSEIEAILSALDFTSNPGPSSPIKKTPAHSAAELPRYDFEHPQPLKRSQLDALRLAAASTCQNVQISLTELLRTPVIVNFLGVEQSTYREFIATAETPSCLALFRPDPQEEPWLIEIDRVMAFTWIDLILGGSPACGQTISLNRHFTDVESRLIEKAVCVLLPAISQGMTRQSLSRIDQLVSDGSKLTEASSNEAVALISMEAVCGASTGLLQLCIPWKPIADSSQASTTGRTRFSSAMKSSAVKVPVVATASIARLTLSAGDLASLKPGDVLLTDLLSNQEIRLEVDGHEIFRGKPGQNHDRKAILLTAPITTPRFAEFSPSRVSSSSESRERG